MRRWFVLFNPLIKKNVPTSRGTRKIMRLLLGGREEHTTFPGDCTTRDEQLWFRTKEGPQKHGVKNTIQSRYAVSSVSKSQK